MAISTRHKGSVCKMTKAGGGGEQQALNFGFAALALLGGLPDGLKRRAGLREKLAARKKQKASLAQHV